MTGSQYQELALRTANKNVHFPHALLVNGAMGLNGEAGEVIDIVKKCLFQGHDLDELAKAKILDECSDVMWYLALICHALNSDLDQVMEHNVEKLKKRYPQGFDAERSIHRADD